MRIVSIGGGPAGLYYAILAKRADPRREVVVHERNRPGDTFGFGVVFSDRTMDNLAKADPESHAEIVASFAHWDDIDIHWKGSVVRSRGHGFAGLERRRLLEILTRRAQALGVDVRFESEIADPRALSASADLVLGADGVWSGVRKAYEAELGPEIDLRPNRFVWLGTTFPFEAFTFYFNETPHGMFRVHAYRYAPGASTFIVECTEDTWRRAGMDTADEDQTIAYCEEVFRKELAGHRLQKNRSVWRQFPNIRNARWSTGNVVLLGDAVHTAHFSIGSGTKLALEDAIALHEAIERDRDVPRALAAYEADRKPGVERLQRAAQVSLEWFEGTERYRALDPMTFAMSLLSRSLRVSHANLRLRDPDIVASVDRTCAVASGALPADAPADAPVPPPMLTPYRVRGMHLANRVVVSPMCQYRAENGVVNDWHLVHLGSRAIGGAGLVIAEMTDVTPEGRITPGCAGLWTPEQAAAFRRITDFVHANGDTKIGVQLAHAGRKAGREVPWKGGARIPGWEVVGPSPIAWDAGSQTPRALDYAGLAGIRDAFVRGAHLAAEAGFDLVELHAAHGYLLSSFLSPLSNRRDDEYGGSLEGRLRFPVEVVRAVREAWGDRPLFVRISATEWDKGGTTPAEAVQIARALVDAGADLIDVSGGGTVPGTRPDRSRMFHVALADRIRHEARVPVMAVGGILTADDANSVIASARADLVAMAREHLADPYFTRHAAIAQGAPLPWPPPYVLARTKPQT